MFDMGIIGAGIIVESHLSAIKSRSDIQLKAVCDLEEERARKAAYPFGAKVYKNYEQMLETENLDAVIINLPHFLHEPCVSVCAAHGVNILCEKPMSISSASCRRMIAICQEKNVVLQIGHIQHYDPSTRAARDLILQGEIGDLLMINDMRYDNYFLPSRPRWFLQKKFSGGGVMINLGAHAIDKICYLTGSEVQEVSGNVTYLHPEFDVEGSAQAFLTMKNGVTATITLCGYDVDRYFNSTIMFGSKGYLKLNCGQDLWISKNGEPLKAVDVSIYEEAFTKQLDDFIKAIQGDEVACPGKYGMHILETIEKVYHSGGVGKQ